MKQEVNELGTVADYYVASLHGAHSRSPPSRWRLQDVISPRAWRPSGFEAIWLIAFPRILILINVFETLSSPPSLLLCKFVFFFMSCSPPTTGLGGALGVCREFLNSSDSGSLAPSRVWSALPRGMLWKWEIKKRCGVAQTGLLVGLHWYSTGVQHLRQLLIVIAHRLGWWLLIKGRENWQDFFFGWERKAFFNEGQNNKSDVYCWEDYFPNGLKT